MDADHRKNNFWEGPIYPSEDEVTEKLKFVTVELIFQVAAKNVVVFGAAPRENCYTH